MPPLTFWPGATRQVASALTANVCIMQMTSCPHKQAGANQCRSSPDEVALIDGGVVPRGSRRRQRKKNLTLTLQPSFMDDCRLLQRSNVLI